MSRAFAVTRIVARIDRHSKRGLQFGDLSLLLDQQIEFELLKPLPGFTKCLSCSHGFGLRQMYPYNNIKRIQLARR